MTTPTETLPTCIEGYDLDAERARCASIPDVVVRGTALNRGTATIRIDGEMETAFHEAARERHRAGIVPTTLAPDSPVLELGWPLSGPFVRCSAGVYMDLYLGVAQKLIDPSHPRLRMAMAALDHAGLLTRREINTDDFLVGAEGLEGVYTPADLAALAADAAAASFPGQAPWKSFLSNSGAEAVEAALKTAWQVAYKRFLETHGFDLLERVAADLGIGRMEGFDDDPSRDEPLLTDYPFFIVGCEGGFHGRTLGALHFTTSKKSQRVGYPQVRWVRRVPYNGSPEDLAALIDDRPIAEILASPDGVRGVVADGRIPRDLFAGFLAEPLQGEGGYVPGDRDWLLGIQRVVREAEGLLLMDEVQTFGRTGTLFLSEQTCLEPDVIATAKGMVVGLTLIRDEHARYLHPGWHSNTWGGGKLFDVQWAATLLDTLLHHEDPALDGLPYLDNVRIKGTYLEACMEQLRARHPDTLVGWDRRGLMLGLSVRHRAEIVAVGWKHGLKLLGCGRPGEVARLRAVFLVDTLAREIDEFVRVMDLVMTEVEQDA